MGPRINRPPAWKRLWPIGVLAALYILWFTLHVPSGHHPRIIKASPVASKDQADHENLESAAHGIHDDGSSNDAVKHEKGHHEAVAPEHAHMHHSNQFEKTRKSMMKRQYELLVDSLNDQGSGHGKGRHQRGSSALDEGLDMKKAKEAYVRRVKKLDEGSNEDGEEAAPSPTPQHKAFNHHQHGHRHKLSHKDVMEMHKQHAQEKLKHQEKAEEEGEVQTEKPALEERRRVAKKKHPRHVKPHDMKPLNAGSSVEEEEARTGDSGHDNGKVDSLQLALFTTLKPCDNPRIKDAQVAAVTSWATLPLESHPVIALMGTDPCAFHVRQAVEQVAGPGRVHVINNVKLGRNGTLLLGSAIRTMESRFPDADVYGLINADIILDPRCAVALRSAQSFFAEFFLIGHRLSVDFLTPIEQGGATFPDFSKPEWMMEDAFKDAKKDRLDAEDYFLWTTKFFSGAGVEVPDFHVGRPAYDNWMVHTAIHTYKPVIDATELFIAYHQRHDYEHLRNKGDKDKKKKATYWGQKEQKENYDLGIANGGWQHGLIEFAPWGFGPSHCSTKYDLERVHDIPISDEKPCSLHIKNDWKPLSNGEYGDMKEWVARYRKHVVPAKRGTYDKRCERDVSGR